MLSITLRTIGGRGLLRPTAALTACILGVLARCLTLYGVELHAFVFLSNHGHLLITAADALQTASFLRDFKRNSALGIQRLTSWRGHVWGRACCPVPVLDDDASIDRLRYILANGVKEGLVDSPLDWPGPNSTRALLGDMRIAAPPFRPRPRHGGPAALERWRLEPGKPQTIQLAPLPVWARRSTTERHALVEGLVGEVVARAEVERAGKPSLGVRRILEMDMFAPIDLEESPPPIAHCSSARTLEQYIAERNAYRASYRTSAAKLRETRSPVPFPVGSFLPSAGFEQD